MKWNIRYAYLLLLLVPTSHLYAQGGCVDSPEHPTALLALFGVAGFAYSPAKKKLVSLWRNRTNK